MTEGLIRYVVDSNIIGHNPNFMSKFDPKKEYEIILPMIVIEELENLKSKSKNQDLKLNIRRFFRLLRNEGLIDGLHKGVRYRHNILIKTVQKYNFDNVSISMDMDYGDNKILALDIFQNEKDAILLSGDIGMVVKANALGIKTQLFSPSNQDRLKELETGYEEISVSKEVAESFYKEKMLTTHFLVSKVKRKIEFFPNKFFILKPVTNPSAPILCRYDGNKKCLVGLKYANTECYGVKAKDIEQKFLFEALLSPASEIPFVTASASVGCGKTFVSMAIALQEVEVNQKYEKLLIAKSTAPLDEWSYLGYTKGDTEQKILTHFGNYATTLENLDSERKNYNSEDRISGNSALIERLEQTKSIEILDIASILGSSFSNKFIIIDEVQNFNIEAMRAIISRIGENCKMVCIGDMNQRTIVQTDLEKTGLYCCVNYLKELSSTAHITLKKNHRSSFSRDAIDIIDKKIYG